MHCGTYKTATSKIQNRAWEHRSNLLAQGWLYPASGIDLDEPEVGFRHAPLVFGYHDLASWTPMVEALVAEIEASPADRVLLSSEGWSRPGQGR